MSDEFGLSTPRSKAWTISLTVAGLLVLVGAAVAIRVVLAGGSVVSSNHADEIFAAQDLVKAKFDLSTQFHQEDVSYESLPEGKIKVSGTVDAISPEGRSGRYSYTVVMHYVLDNGWIPDDISIIPI